MTLSVPEVAYSRTGYFSLEGMVTEDAAISINGTEIPTTPIEHGVSFWYETTLTQPATELTVQAIAGNTTREEAISVIYDPELVEQLVYVTELDIESMALTADFVTMLHGEEALAAAREDGAIGAEEDLPGDFYIRNQNPLLRTFDLSPTIEPVLLACYQNGPCIRQRAVSLNEWSELMAIYEQPDQRFHNGWSWYGGGNLPYTLAFRDDQLVQITEFYLP